MQPCKYGTVIYLADILDQRHGQRRISWSVGDEEAVVVETHQVLIPRYEVDLCTPLHTENTQKSYGILY